MNIPRTHQVLAMAATLALAVGCMSQSSRFYTLNSTATRNAAPPVNIGIEVGPVTIPRVVDRPQLTLQVAPNRLEIAEFDRWAAPLNDSIARVIAADLAVQLGTTCAATSSLTHTTPTVQVAIDIQRFESQRDAAHMQGSVLIDATWLIRRADGSTVQAGCTQASEPVSGEGFEAFAAAHSRALAQISGDIAAAIRANFLPAKNAPQG